MQIQLSTPDLKASNKLALFNLGFRPFFLGAAIFAVISMAFWMLIYFSYISISIKNITVSQWHAHEMLYGFGMAVVAGFLLTAVKNWTGVATASGRQLITLFSFWCLARVLFLCGSGLMLWAAIADLLFDVVLIAFIAIPIIKARQWKQLPIVSKVILLWCGNIIFYLGYFGILSKGMLYAINGSVLLFISLILMLGRRVIPFFIERGTEIKVQLKQYKWLDLSILIVFIALFINTIFLQITLLTAPLAWTLFILNGYRLFNWHIAGIWHIPLLWSLYLSAWIINLGFFFFGLQSQYGSLSILTLHIFTIGGIGLMSLSMMSRVSLGHTGRDIRKPSRWLKIAFSAITASVTFRAVVPMFIGQWYMSWILLAGIFWILGFVIFIVIYTPILLKPRVDGMLG